MLYGISNLKTEGNDFSASILFDENHKIFKGHFPGQPVVPGVCLIHIVKEAFTLIAGKEMLLTKGSNIKFLHVVDPNANAEVQIKGTFISGSDRNIKVSASIFNDNIIFCKFTGLFTPATT